MCDGKRERHRDRSIDRVTAALHDVNPDLRRYLIRRRHHPMSRTHWLTRSGMRYVDKRQHPNQKYTNNSAI
jgi:hypothetical protein